MPGYITRVVPETRLDQLVRRLRERNSPLVFVDPRADLWAARRRVQLYSRYENHWNQVGGFVAYLATMRAAERLLPGIPNLKDEDITVGTSWRSWQNPPFGERVFTVTLKFPSRVTGTEVIAAAGPEKISKVTTGLDQAPSVLLYGDSFGVLGLLAYLKESFRWSMYVPTAHVSFPFDLIERHKPDLVILEMVERFLSGYLPDDPRADRDLLLREAPPFEMAVKSKELAGGGYIEGVINEGNDTVLFPGWAMDPSDRTPARGIFAYQSGRVVGVAWPTMRRPDLAAGAPSDLVAFRMPVPLAVAREPLSFFSVNRGGTIRPLVVIPEAAAQIDALKR
jgi:hypothetical protein